MATDDVRQTPTTVNSRQENFGPQLRELRKARGLTLQKLAAEIGKTAGFISQIERGLAQPSYATLQALVRVLGVPMGWFDSESRDQPGAEYDERVVRAGNRRRLRYNEAVHGSGFADELLSPHLHGNLVAAQSRLAPGGTWGRYDTTREYDVLLIVLSGSVEVTDDGHAVVLLEGDSMQYTLLPGSTGHEVRNVSQDNEAVVIWVGAPLVLDV